MPTKLIVAVSAALASVALVACGNPPAKDVPAKGETATPEQALQEIDVVRKDLIRVTHMLQTGRRKPAGEVAAETYVQHYEKVEHVLGGIDKKLNEKIEENLSGKLRQEIRGKTPVKKIVKFITAIDADLGRAQDELKGKG